MSNAQKLIKDYFLLLIPAFLISCGGGGGGGGDSAPSVVYYNISGTITGLTGSGLVLQNNGGDNLSIPSGSISFTFPTPLANGAPYSITVLQQPTGQICTVNRGSGNVSNSNVTNIMVICSSASYSVGGEVRGLLGSGLVIRNNNADSKSISANGAFTFTTPVAAGAGYNVTVLVHPSSPSQKCVVSNGLGNVFTGAIANVIIDCDRSAQHFAYVANSGDGTVSMYKINALTGHLQTNGSIATGTNPQFITIDPFYPNNPYAYVVDRLSSEISAYSIDQDLGTLTAIGSPLPTGALPQSATVDLNSEFVYVVNSGSDTLSVFSIAPGSGALAWVSTVATGSAPQAIGVTSEFAYVANSGDGTISAYAIDDTTGDLTPIDNLSVVELVGADYLPTAALDNFPAGINPQSITIDPYGFIYVANSGSDDISVYFLDVDGQLIPIDADYTTPGIENFAAGDAPRSVTIDPYGLFAYVANSASNTISAYKINGNSGQLMLAGTIATGTSPQPVQVDPTGQFAYVANSGTNNVSGYKIDPTTGALTSVGPPVVAGTDPRSVSFDALGHFAYAINNGSATLSAYRIDGTTGVLTPVSGSPYAAESGPQAVTIDPSGRFAYVSNRTSNTISAYAIDALTRALDPVPGSPFPAGTTPQPVAVEPGGVYAYVVNNNNGGAGTVSAYLIDYYSGGLTLLGTYATGNNPQAAAIDPRGQFVYVPNKNSNSVSAYAISGGELTLIETTGTTQGVGFSPTSVAFHPNGNFAYVTNSGSANPGVSAFAIEPTGALTYVNFTSTEINPQPVMIDSGGLFAYVANAGSNTLSVYSINGMTGALSRADIDPDTAGIQSQIITTGTTPQAVTVNSTDRFIYVANSGSDNVSAFSNDGAGELTLIGTVAAGTTPQTVTLDPTGLFAYVSNSGSDDISVYSIDGSGALIPIDADGGASGIQNFAAGDSPVTVSIGIDPITSQLFAYVSNSMSSNVAAYTIKVTGELTPVPGSPYPTGSSPTSIAITK